ncbi:MAG: sulfotransferase domain-containing protein, partial [Magnetococcales bacterium]|nr:sulfotransferase domain-containing protein [Magnetococcales bacterium]
VASSFRKMVNRQGKGQRPVYESTMVWRHSVQSAMKHNMLTVRYEDLVHDHTGKMVEIFDYLELDFDQKQLERFDEIARYTIPSAHDHFRHNNLTGDINQKSIGKYKQNLTPEEIAIIDHLTRKEQDLLGFSAADESQNSPPSGYFAHVARYLLVRAKTWGHLRL